MSFHEFSYNEVLHECVEKLRLSSFQPTEDILAVLSHFPAILHIANAFATLSEIPTKIPGLIPAKWLARFDRTVLCKPILRLAEGMKCSRAALAATTKKRHHPIRIPHVSVAAALRDGWYLMRY